MLITSGSRLETGQFNKGVDWQVNLDDVIAVHERPAAVLRRPAVSCSFQTDRKKGNGIQYDRCSMQCNALSQKHVSSTVTDAGSRPLIPAISKNYDTQNSTKLYKEIILHIWSQVSEA